MSALTEDIGGMFNVLVDVPRVMSPLEAREFLATGKMPNLSQPPPEDAEPEVGTELTETEARLWLNTLTASVNPAADHITVRGDGDIVTSCGCTVQTEQTGTNSETLSSP